MSKLEFLIITVLGTVAMLLSFLTANAMMDQ